LAQPVVVTKFPEFEHHWTEGDPVTVIGNALGSMKWIVSVGVISGQERTSLLTDARINHGNSGGPWFDKDGNIVALTDWGISPKDGPGIAGGVSAATIEAFFERRDKMASLLNKLLGGVQ
jgi:S1-C subfamily serine protease